MDQPTLGSGFTTAQFREVWERVKERRNHFPGESEKDRWGVVLFNLGGQFTPVNCVNGEWSGQKKDIPKSDGIPKCPLGHVLLESTEPVRLGWVEGESPV